VEAWVAASRPQTLTVAVAPVLLGAALAAEVTRLQIPLLIATLIGAICIQIGTNLFNDYADFKKGTDGADRLGPARACASGWLNPDHVLFSVWIVYAIAIAAGVYLVLAAGWPILVIGIASLICGLAYTGGPWPLSYVGIADLFVFVFFGLVAVGGTFFVLTGTLSTTAVLGGAVLGCLATAVLAANNLRDRKGDRQAGKKTLAVRYGEAFARNEFALLITAPALMVLLVAIFVPGAGPGWLAPLALAPWLVQLTRDAFRLDGRDLNILLKKTAVTELAFSILLCAGIILT
jgi:1,4-dihydroxy-2-naphthoate octaprenyltransferase